MGHYVFEEFDAFMKCGIPAYGFLRLACKTCQERRFFHLVVNAEASVHPDGVFTKVHDLPRFRPLTAMTDQDVATIISHIAERVRRLCIRRGYLDPDGAIVQSPDADSLFADHDALTHTTQSSIAGKIAFGPRAGQYVRRIGGGFGYEDEVPLAKGRLCFAVNGFSLHANTAINTHARDRLAQLVEYLARGPISNERLEIIADGPDAGDIKLALKTAWRSGTTHLRLSPSEFVEKLVSLIPPPKSHLVRWGGVFASNSPYRSCITLRPSVKKGFQFGHACDEATSAGAPSDGAG